MSQTNKISGNEGKLDVPLSRSYHRKPRGGAVQQRLRSLALRVLIINTMASSEVHVHTHLGTDKSTP